MNAELVVSRRGFLGIFSAGAFVLATKADTTNWQPSVYLGMEPNGIVTIVAHRSEMGTGIRTALPMVAADELDAGAVQQHVHPSAPAEHLDEWFRQRAQRTSPCV